MRCCISWIEDDSTQAIMHEGVRHQMITSHEGEVPVWTHPGMELHFGESSCPFSFQKKCLNKFIDVSVENALHISDFHTGSMVFGQ